MPKNDNLHSQNHNTYLMASTLMQKLMLTHQKNTIMNLQSQDLTIEDDQITHHNRNLNSDLDPNTVRISNDLTTDRPTFHLNLQYQPVILPNNNKYKLSKLSNPSKLKPIKNLQPNPYEQRDSKMLQKLKRNIINIYDEKTEESSRKYKHHHTHTQQQQPEQKQTVQKHRGKSHERDKSPNKVSVNFQLFFPKQKLRTTINHTKTSTRHSLGLRNLDTDLFRIKKSTKSISLHHEQKEKSSDLQKKKTLLSSTDRSKGEEILVGLKKNAALKYIQKVEKFKKYKDNKMNKQPLFGLNVMQAEYHELKVENETKNNKQKHSKTKKPQFFQQKYTHTSNNNQLTKDNRSQVLMNITMSQGVSISLNNRHQDPQVNHQVLQNSSKQKQIQQSSSPQKDSKKCPSEQKLISKTFFGPAQVQRRRLMIKNKMQQDTWIRDKQNCGIKSKLKSMLQCLDVILNAYCCRITPNQPQSKIIANKSLISSQLPSEIISQQKIRDLSMTISQPFSFNPKKEKFLYFVGNGNNKNLIRSIMKKREWWAETQNIEVAHFVWTQLKVKEVLDRETKMDEKTIEEPDSWNFKIREQQDPTSPKHNKNKQQSSSKIEVQHISQHYLKIFHKQMLPTYTKKIHQKQKQNQYLRPLSLPSVIHNHYDANYMLGNKKALFYNLLEYCSYKKVPPNSIIPLTFHVESIESRQFKNFIKSAKKLKNALWIVKPGENSNRGNGIFVEKDLEKIRAHIQKNADDKHSFIIQKYLKNIFLYNKRKFDIRVYMIMSTIGGITKFYWYEEGYIRTSSQIYNTEDIKDLFIHLTNDAIQNKNDTYSKYEKGNKISYTEFQRYLDMNYHERYSVQDLVRKMKQVAETVVRSTYFKLDKSKKVNGFQLFGLDFLVDKDFNPWLLQVNTNPCLQLSSPVLERLIPRMLQNMLRLTIDPIFRPNQSLSRHSSYFLYNNVFETNKLQLIFDSLFDSDFQWEQICLKGINVVYEDEDEVFDSNGVQVEVAD